MEQRNNLKDFIKYLKNVSWKKLYQKFGFNKQCLQNNTIPNYAILNIKGHSDWKYNKYNYIEIEEMLYEFGGQYTFICF